MLRVVSYELSIICLPCGLSVNDRTSHSYSRLVPAGLYQRSTAAVDVNITISTSSSRAPFYNRKPATDSARQRARATVTISLTRVQLARGPDSPAATARTGTGTCLCRVRLAPSSLRPWYCVRLPASSYRYPQPFCPHNSLIGLEYEIAENQQLSNSEEHRVIIIFIHQ